MSNAIRYDSFLVHWLAAELHRELVGKRVAALQFDSAEQRVLIDVDDTRIVWQLHPADGHVSRTAPLYPLPDSAILPKKARIASVSAFEDERIMKIELAGEKRENATVGVVIELLTNQWNAIALDASGRVLRVLKLREAGRTFRRGRAYEPPAHPEPGREPYRSPLNDALSSGQLASMLREAPLPALLPGGQPYPHHLWQPDARAYPTLLAAFAAVAGTGSSEVVIKELERRARMLDKKRDKLIAEIEKAKRAEHLLRQQGDVLLAYATTVTRGVARVTLPAFSGGEIEIELDPKLSAVDNAQLLYAEARKQERAIARLPALIEETESQIGRLEGLLERARKGELSDTDFRRITEQRSVKPQQHVERLPYRRYQTSGGLEVRVGRNAKSNDELTLKHSSPRDFWLHARHAGGAHVVLRWNDAEANPPMRDIMEAAALAALHSTARTSKTVPVDYTRRKYVRKPRRSAPGSVVMERAKTVFVEPEAEIEARLRTE